MTNNECAIAAYWMWGGDAADRDMLAAFDVEATADVVVEAGSFALPAPETAQ